MKTMSNVRTRAAGAVFYALTLVTAAGVTHAHAQTADHFGPRAYTVYGSGKWYHADDWDLYTRPHGTAGAQPSMTREDPPAPMAREDAPTGAIAPAADDDTTTIAAGPRKPFLRRMMDAMMGMGDHGGGTAVHGPRAQKFYR